MNHLLSLNIDRRWRAFTTRAVPPTAGLPVLDCCTGTADLALAYDIAARRQCRIFGTDFCRPMLEIGRDKALKTGACERVSLIEADTQQLPFPDDTFGVVSVAFGLRNVADTSRGLAEMVRVACPGGRLAILEFSRPRVPVLSHLYLAFFRHVLPRVGQSVAPNSDDAYRYLPASVLEFPEGQDMLDTMTRAGLVNCRLHRLTGGIATLYVGEKGGITGSTLSDPPPR